jgi:hypothetical protein
MTTVALLNALAVTDIAVFVAVIKYPSGSKYIEFATLFLRCVYHDVYHDTNAP